ncbi:MAG TPA: hypothetical protein VNX67_10380 [Solirubrobacteraceae bacterium]|jgi:ABC-2 type transport system permease protein|nr:hypothetical protein [Solirubrobacteraceae bacterium]
MNRAFLRRPAAVLARRAFRGARVRTIAFGYLFALYAYIQPVGYRHAYPTFSDRLAFARSFAGNDALRLFYGYPYDPLTVSGYSAWRVAGTLAILAAVFGLLAAVRALRGEEDSGRMELVLAGAVGRRTAYLSAMVAIAPGVLILWLAESVGFIVGGLPVGGSAYLALALLFLGVAGLAYAIVPRTSTGIAYGLLTVTFLWQLTGSLPGAPKWLVDLTPFAHVGLVPAQPLRAGAAVVMLAAAVSCSLAATWVFRRRDLTGQ